MVGVTRPASSDTGKNKYLNIQSRLSFIHGQHEFKAEFLSSSTGQTEQLQTVFTEKRSAFPV